MIAYYIRHSMNASGDIKRGFSASGSYVLSRTSEIAALKELMAYVEDVDLESLVGSGMVLWHDELKGWVEPHCGLCAHAVYETLDEAVEAVEADLVEWRADSGMSDMGTLYVFEGERIFEATNDPEFVPTGRCWTIVGGVAVEISHD